MTVMSSIKRLIVLLAVLQVAIAAEVHRTVDIFAWPLTAAKSSPLTKISYSYPSLNATIKSFIAPQSSRGDEWVRIGFYKGGNEWSGMAVSPRIFNPGQGRKLELMVDAQGEPLHVALRSVHTQPLAVKTSKQSGSAQSPPPQQRPITVEIVRQLPGPQPELNKPVVLSPDGKLEDKEPEKTFLQK